MKRKILLTLIIVFSAFVSACTDSDKIDKEAEDAEPDNVKENDDSGGYDISNDAEVDEGLEEEVDAEESNRTEKEFFYADALEIDVPLISEDQLELAEESYEYIVDNYNLFPAKKDKEVNKAIEKSETIDYRELSKNPAKYHSNIVSFSGFVRQIDEQNVDDETMTYAIVYDDNSNAHVIFMYKEAEEIYEDDDITFYGIPIGAYDFSSDDGGFQSSILYFGSHIEKQ